MLSMKARLSTLALALGLMIATAAHGAGGFGAPVVVTGLDTAEPGVDVAPDGTIYVNAPAGLLSHAPGSPSFVFRSDGGGATWTLTPPGNLIAEPGTGTHDSGDRVGLIYATSTGGIKFARSTDGALSFTNVVVSPASSADTTHAFPVVASAGDGSLHAVWLEVFGTASSRIRYARSADWGAHWTAPASLVSGGASVYPWVAAGGSKVSVTLYHT